MKIFFLIILTYLSFDSFGQTTKKELEIKINDIEKELDSVREKLLFQIELFHRVKDSLQKEIPQKNPSPKTPKTKQKPELILTSTLINRTHWNITNLGGHSSINYNDVDNVRNFLSENGILECLDEECWKNNIAEDLPAYILLNEPYTSLGYFFNKQAIVKLQEALENTEWKIAEYADFNKLFQHSESLKLKNYTPFQLIVGNPNVSENALKKNCSWTNQSVFDIYGLNIYPYNYFTGYFSLLKNKFLAITTSVY